MHVGEAGIEEPMWIYLSFMRRVRREQWFIGHPIGIREITGITLTTPRPLRSKVSQKIVESGILATRTEATSLLEIEFDGNRRKEHMDFRPHLPVIRRARQSREKPTAQSGKGLPNPQSNPQNGMPCMTCAAFCSPRAALEPLIALVDASPLLV
jgi:hypothetical protein